MASQIIDFLTITPIEGTGVRDLQLTAQANTGRNSRTATYKAYGKPPYDNIESSNYLIVTQSGKNDPNKEGFIAEVSAPTPTATDTQATHTFVSNFSTLTLVVPSNPSATISSAVICGRTLNASELVALTGSGYAVKDSQGNTDPGRYSQYEISIVFNIPQNQQQTQQVYSYTINGEQFSFTQSAAAAPQTSIRFASTVGTDTDAVEPYNVTVSLSASGDYSDEDNTRQIKVVTTPSTDVSWSINSEPFTPEVG